MNEIEIKSGFFNAELVEVENEDGTKTTQPDRTYNATDLNEYLKGLISDDGIFANVDGACQVVKADGLNIIVKTGRGKVNNHWFANSSETSLEIEPADVLLTRKDRIVVRWCSDERKVVLKVLTGKPSENPEPPVLDREHDYDISLAIVTVEPNATTIETSKIHDTRPDSSVCGWIACLIEKIDTEDIYNNYEEDIENWFVNIQNTFENWFTDTKDTVAATSMVRMYSATYNTTTENEQEIAIPGSINYSNNGLDILMVEVSGRSLVENVDYEISSDGTKVIFEKPILLVGTKINFRNIKSVDGLAAESVVLQVEDLQEQVDALELNNNFNYVANGVNDNVQLSNIVKDFLNGNGDYATAKDNASLLINVNGELAFSELIEGQMVFDFHNTVESNRRVIVDFGNATIKYSSTEQVELLAIVGCNDNVTIKHANIYITGAKATTIYGFHGGVIKDCWLTLTGNTATTVYGVWSGEVSDSKINVDGAYAVYESARCQFNDITGNVTMSSGFAIGNSITGTATFGDNVQDIGNVIEEE